MTNALQKYCSTLEIWTDSTEQLGRSWTALLSGDPKNDLLIALKADRTDFEIDLLS